MSVTNPPPPSAPPPPPPGALPRKPTWKTWWFWSIIVGGVALAALTLSDDWLSDDWLSDDLGSVGGPVHVDDPEIRAVDYEVLSCEVEFAIATATVRFTVDQPFSYVSFTGDFEDPNGVVLGQGIGIATDVVPGKTYRTEVFYSLSGDPSTGTCNVDLDLDSTN